MSDVGRGSHRVRALVRPGGCFSELTSLGAEVVFGDIGDPGAMRKLVADADGAVLLHLAGVIHPRRSTTEFAAVNVEGTRNVVMAATEAGIKRIVAMSSNSPIGASKNPAEVFDEDSPYNPYMGYGRSKRAMEEWLRAHSAVSSSTEITIVRAPWFYGPGQPERQTRFFTMIKQGRFPLMGRGEARRSLGYVDSLAYGILLAAASARAAGSTYWLADERPYSMSEIVHTVRTVLRDDFGMMVSSKAPRVPSFVSDIARIADWTLQRVRMYNQTVHVLSEMNLTIACAIAKAKRELGYRPLVELREGMRRSVEWCLTRHMVI
jgi:nucleoside-diphosphate-sugar epimerase